MLARLADGATHWSGRLRGPRRRGVTASSQTQVTNVFAGWQHRGQPKVSMLVDHYERLDATWWCAPTDSGDPLQRRGDGRGTHCFARNTSVPTNCASRAVVPSMCSAGVWRPDASGVLAPCREPSTAWMRPEASLTPRESHDGAGSAGQSSRTGWLWCRQRPGQPNVKSGNCPGPPRHRCDRSRPPRRHRVDVGGVSV